MLSRILWNFLAEKTVHVRKNSSPCFEFYFSCWLMFQVKILCSCVWFLYIFIRHQYRSMACESMNCVSFSVVRIESKFFYVLKKIYQRQEKKSLTGSLVFKAVQYQIPTSCKIHGRSTDA